MDIPPCTNSSSILVNADQNCKNVVVAPSKSPRAPKLLVSDVQSAVHRMVQMHGGYWRPTSAAFHLYEELILIDEALAGGLACGNEIAKHLTELFVASVCIATQYSVSLKRAYADAEYEGDLSSLLASRSRTNRRPLNVLLHDVKHRAAECARIITFYDLDRLPIDSMNLPTLHELLPHLQVCILDALASTRASFRTCLEKNLRDAADSLRFERPFDPGTAPCIAMFKPIQESTFCPFANSARLWGAPPYQTALSFRENIRAALPLLASFTRVARKEILDGFLFAFPAESLGGDIESLCRITKSLISFLSVSDPVLPRDEKFQDVARPGWRFAFCEEEYFVNVFAPFYAHGHSRHTYTSRDVVFIMLQPETSFHARIPKEKFQTVRDQIRQKFDDALQGYQLDELEAHRFILPPSHDSPLPVKWYEAKDLE